MERLGFEALRDLPRKLIKSDIVFMLAKQHGESLTFDHIEVENELGYGLLLNGTFVPGIPSVKFNFVIVGVGPICRFEVNSVVHKNAGRTHKHSLKTERCPSRNLPFAEQIGLDISVMSVAEIWKSICNLAGIIHTGRFVDPG